jgi:hypothetical protein
MEPIAPFAPALLRTTMGCGNKPWTAFARLRAARSASPPVLKGTTMVTGWFG